MQTFVDSSSGKSSWRFSPARSQHQLFRYKRRTSEFRSGKLRVNLNEESRPLWIHDARSHTMRSRFGFFFFFLRRVRAARTSHIRFRSRSPRSHVKSLDGGGGGGSGGGGVSPKRQVPHSALRRSRYGCPSARTMRAEIRGRSGARIMVTPRVVLLSSSPGPAFLPSVPSLNHDVYALQAAMRPDIMHPHQTRDDTATCPPRYSDLGGKAMPGQIAPGNGAIDVSQYRRFAKTTASPLSEVCDSRKLESPAGTRSNVRLRRSKPAAILCRFYRIGPVRRLGEIKKKNYATELEPSLPPLIA